MVQIIKEKTALGGLLSGLGQGVQAGFEEYGKAKEKKEREETYKRLFGMDFSGLDPETQRALGVEQLRGKNKLAEYQAEQAQKLRSQQTKDQQEDAALRQLEKDRGLEPGALNAYKGNLALGERATKPKAKTQASQPIDPQQMEAIERARAVPGYDEMNEVQQYRELQKAGVSRENSEAEAKLTGQQLARQGNDVQRSYDAQKDFIKDTSDSYRSFEEQTKPKLLQMQHLPPQDIIGPTADVFLEELGIPLGALDNPASELYQKLSTDLLKGLPETYGNRILKVEVDNFLKTIPTLKNSVEGRRMIASNMLKLGEMKKVYYNEMRRQQQDIEKTGSKYPRDFQQSVMDQVKPQIDRINDEFVKMSEITAIPEGKIPFFDPSGTIRFVDPDKVEWATTEGGGKRIW